MKYSVLVDLKAGGRKIIFCSSDEKKRVAVICCLCSSVNILNLIVSLQYEGDSSNETRGKTLE